MKKSVLCLGLSVLMFVSILGSVSAMSDPYNRVKQTATYLTFGVKADDSFIFDVTEGITLNLNDTMWAKFDAVMANTTLAMNFTKNDSKALYNDLYNLKPSVQVQMKINSLLGEKVNNTNEDFIYVDTINGSIKMRTKGTSDFLTYENWAKQYLTETNATIQEKYAKTMLALAVNQSIGSEIEYINTTKDELENIEIQHWMTYDNVSKEVEKQFPNLNCTEFIPTFTSLPMDMTKSNPFNLMASAFPMIIPNELDMGAVYSNITKFINCSYAENGLALLAQNRTMNEWISDFGIINGPYIDARAFGVVMELKSMNRTNTYVNDTVSEILGMYSKTGLNITSFKVSFAVEYSENGVLSTGAFYVTAGFDLNVSKSALPDMFDEFIDFGMTSGSFKMSFTVGRDGATPPSEDDIESGKIGSNRSAIPGFPMEFTMFVGLITVAGTIIRIRKREN